MDGINEFTVREIKKWDVQTVCDGKWVPARPIGLSGLRHRLKMALKVFTGRADVLTWECDPKKDYQRTANYTSSIK